MSELKHPNSTKDQPLSTRTLGEIFVVNERLKRLRQTIYEDPSKHGGATNEYIDSVTKQFDGVLKVGGK